MVRPLLIIEESTCRKQLGVKESSKGLHAEQKLNG